MNHRITRARCPHGPVGPECFATDDVPAPEPGPGEALVEVKWLSIDPTIRGWMSQDTYLPAIEIGEPIGASGLGEVIASHNDDLPVGSMAFGMVGWQQYAIVGEGTQVIPEGIEPEANRRRVTRCWSREPPERPGRSSARSPRSRGAAAGIAEHCPNGIDVFFDNVGGDILEAALDNLAMKARVVLCGAIATYNDETPRPGPANLMNLVVMRARMEGFLILDYMDRATEAIMELAGWVLAGRLTYTVDVVEGLDNAPAAFEKLFTGANTGKVLVKL